MIDRKEVVSRHKVRMQGFDPRSPLTVGNGTFAFGVDATGLQSFPEPYETGTPLCTMSDWGWHSKPMPAGLDPSKIRYSNFDTYGRPVGHITSADGQKDLFDWLRENPHRFHLGRVGLEVTMSDGRMWTIQDVREINQTLDPWTGLITSSFVCDGQPVSVETCCAGGSDAIGVRVKSPLLASGRLRLIVKFPYGSQGMSGAEWDKDDLHTTRFESAGTHAVWRRTMDDVNCSAQLLADTEFTTQRTGPHAFAISTPKESIAFTITFGLKSESPDLTFEQAVEASAKFWREFWSSGGAIDFAGSTDPRANELERRVILSQYLLRINSSSPLPPAETGLTCNSWYGKFHLEMHWWHGVHHALWGRLHLLEPSLKYYKNIFHVARDIAKRQGYAGVRWPKMVGPSGVDAPSPVGPLLIWQQPHPIYYAELVYREKPTPQTLKEWSEIVFETAEFMADFAHYDEKSSRYVLGPPIKTVSENTNPRTSINPAFELTYWRFGLRVALDWKKRLGEEAPAKWVDVLNKLAHAAIVDGKYVMQEDQLDTFTNWNWEHPAVTGAIGVLAGDALDTKIMKATVEQIMSNWQWDRCWGWDFPMVAMCAARNGRPHLAIDAFFIQSIKNGYVANGHNPQRASLPLYLPGNGGLLSAVAMMAVGWGDQTGDAPGFPKSGWSVRSEGLKPIF